MVLGRRGNAAGPAVLLMQRVNEKPTAPRFEKVTKPLKYN